MKSNVRLTINDIAKLANTSKTTVSFYLNNKTEKMSDETRERIRKVIEETNYTPNPVARSLNSKSTKLIGVLIGDITNDFANKIVKGIDDVVQQHHYQVLIGNTNYNHETEVDYVSRMLEMGVDGFIVQPTVMFGDLIDKIHKSGKFLVFIDSQVETLNLNVIKANHKEAVYDTTKTLATMGYESFVMITANPKILSTRIERVEGFTEAVKELGVDHQIHIIEESEYSQDKLETVLKTSVDTRKKTLLFVANYWLLPEVFLVARALELPLAKNVGLIGFDNTEWTEYATPSITTIVQPAYKEGRRAADLLIASIENNTRGREHTTLQCTVNWQDSTKICD